MTNVTTYLSIKSFEDADCLMARLRVAAERAQYWLTSSSGDPLATLRAIKFQAVGFHPIDHHRINRAISTACPRAFPALWGKGSRIGALMKQGRNKKGAYAFIRWKKSQRKNNGQQ